MKKLWISSILLFAIAFLSFDRTPPSTWTFDDMHSRLGFSIGYLSISEIEGSFRIKESALTTENDDFSDSVVTLTADVNSVDTDVADRDKHLKTADFFDAEKYPVITFKSNSFKKAGDKNYKVTGDLSFHGITKSVTLDAIAKMGEHPMNKKPIAGFKVTGIIKRSDFEISRQTPTAFLSDEVTMNANIIFTKN